MKDRSAILQIFNGYRGRHDDIALSEEYFKKLSDYNEADAAFREKLKQFPELLEEYDKNFDFYDLVVYEEVSDVYSEGFRFGALVALDIMGIN